MEVDTNRPYEPDDATATLILQLQSEDIEELLNGGKGKGRDDEISDAQLAAAAYQQELQTMITILSDRYMSKSLMRAVISDAALLNESLAEENTAVSDRALAHSLGGVNPRSAISQNVSADELSDNFISRLAALYVNSVDGSLEDAVVSESAAVAESSTWAASRPAITASCHCIACNSLTPRSDVCQTPCGHLYCQECIQNLFKSSTADESLYSPRCCRQVISLSSVQIYLSPAAVQDFEKKSVEFETSDRTYCSRQTCSSFIPSEHITSERAECEECGTHTCTICKTSAHDGDCPQDVATQQVLEIAREQGWQRCFNCRRLVELEIGCNHMTCRCKAQFCYVCGESWKTCSCDQWNEDRLLARANQLVHRRGPQAGIAREEEVGQAIADLRERHNCTHENWIYTAGPHQCEECHYHLPNFIFECRQCHILACSRCRNNRL